MRKIVVNPDICNGRPTIERTRITAQTILEFLSAGDDIEDVLEEYPTLSREDVLACLGFSSQLMKQYVEALLPLHKLICVYHNRIESFRD